MKSLKWKVHFKEGKYWIRRWSWSELRFLYIDDSYPNDIWYRGWGWDIAKEQSASFKTQLELEDFILKHNLQDKVSHF